MTLQAAITALCDLEKSLRITDPFTSQIKAAYPLPPSRQMSGLPDVPCWINVWGLQQVMNLAPYRIERYSITCQLLVNDADTFVAANMATSFATEFIQAWEGNADLDGTVVGSDLRARDPSVVNLEWGGQSYAGIQFTMTIDVAAVAGDGSADDTAIDDVIQTLINWTAGKLPNWQQDLNTWKPTADSPGILWFYIQTGGPVDGPDGILTFDYGWEGATVAARLVTPSRQSMLLAIRTLTRALGHDRQDRMLMPDQSWLCYDAIKSQLDVTGGMEGQLQMNVKWILDESLPDDVWWDPGFNGATSDPVVPPPGWTPPPDPTTGVPPPTPPTLPKTTDGSGDGYAWGPFPCPDGGVVVTWAEAEGGVGPSIDIPAACDDEETP